MRLGVIALPSLEDVYEAIAADPYWNHLRRPGIRLVRGFGCRRPLAAIWGEAPGATENVRERPFCGPSGQVLNHLMGLAGLALEDREVDGGLLGDVPITANAFVTNVVKYRPPNNTTPSIAEILHAREGFKQKRITAGFKHEVDESLPEGAGSLRDEWKALGRPRVIVLVGGVAHAAMSPMNFEGVTRWAGIPIPRRDKARDHDIWFISQLHPAYGLRKGPKVQDQMSEHWTKMGEFLAKEGLL